jgi:hypothetical protein
MQLDPISSPMSEHRTYQLLDARPARSRRIWSPRRSPLKSLNQRMAR